MKSIAASNSHLRSATARKEGIERNVRSSSSIEGVSVKTFRSAASGCFVASKRGANTTTLSQGRPKKK